MGSTPISKRNQRKARLAGLYRSSGGLENIFGGQAGYVGVAVGRTTLVVEVKANHVCVAYYDVSADVTARLAVTITATVTVAIRQPRAAYTQEQNDGYQLYRSLCLHCLQL